MKKEKMITRTIITTAANCKFFDMDKNIVNDSIFCFTGKLDDKEIENAVKDEFEDAFRFGKGHFKYITINSVDYIERLYGVTESAFLSIAEELPPRKVNETQEDV